MTRHPPQYLEVTKHEAAYRQITRAIEAFWKGDYDISITLALAAEGMAVPSDTGLFANMVDRRPDGFTRQEWVSIVNCERDWLKHPTMHVLGEAAKFDWDDAGYAISRALTRWPDWTPIMHEFKDWYVNYIRYHPKHTF